MHFNNKGTLLQVLLYMLCMTQKCLNVTEWWHCPSLLSVACKNLLPSRMGVKFRVPLQKLHPLSRAIHHRYCANNNPQRPPHCSAARHYTSLSRLPMRPPKSRSGGHGYQQHRSFWVASLAARLLKLRYILLGSAVGGGYTAKKVCLSSRLCCAYEMTGSRPFTCKFRVKNKVQSEFV